MAIPTVAEVKANLILTTTEDDTLIQGLIDFAVAYAEKRQHKEDGYYSTEDATMSASTKQAIIFLASSAYESRDGSTGGFFADSTQAMVQTYATADLLLLLDKDWVI